MARGEMTPRAGGISWYCHMMRLDLREAGHQVVHSGDDREAVPGDEADWQPVGILDRLRDGKPDAEAGSRAGVTFDIDTTPVLCDDPMARGQAEAHPFPRRLGRVKGIENAGKDRLRDSRPVVANLDHDLTVVGPGLNRDQPLVRA